MMFDHEDRMTGTDDWLARCLVAMAGPNCTVRIMPASITIPLADGTQKATKLQHTLLVGVTVFGGPLAYGHASDLGRLQLS